MSSAFEFEVEFEFEREGTTMERAYNLAQYAVRRRFAWGEGQVLHLRSLRRSWQTFASS